MEPETLYAALPICGLDPGRTFPLYRRGGKREQEAPSPNKTPLPTSWVMAGSLVVKALRDLQADMSQQYVSKLDAFDSFVSHAKLAPLDLRPVSATAAAATAGAGEERRRKVVLVDDLPHVNAPEQRRRLAASLGVPCPDPHTMLSQKHFAVVGSLLDLPAAPVAANRRGLCIHKLPVW